MYFRDYIGIKNMVGRRYKNFDIQRGHWKNKFEKRFIYTINK